MLNATVKRNSVERSIRVFWQWGGSSVHSGMVELASLWVDVYVNLDHVPCRCQ